MSFTKNLFLFILGAIAFVGCGDDDLCDGKECPEGQILNTVNCECVELATEDQVLVSTNITSDVTWTADKEYLLGGRISVVPLLL